MVAASRARAPLHDDPLLLRHRLDAAGQGRALATGLDFRTVSGTYSDRGGRRSYTHYYWRVTVEQGCVDLTSDQPTADRRRGEWTPELEDLVGHLAAIWPHDAEHFLALVPHRLRHHRRRTVARRGPGARDAVASPRRLGGLAAATVAVGLSAGRADQRLTAVDTFHDLVATGRISPDALADAMVLTAVTARHPLGEQPAGRVRDRARRAGRGRDPHRAAAAAPARTPGTARTPRRPARGVPAARHRGHGSCTAQLAADLQRLLEVGQGGTGAARVDVTSWAVSQRRTGPSRRTAGTA